MASLSSKQEEIKRMTNIEEVKKIALQLLRVVWYTQRGNEGRYEAQGWGMKEWIPIVDGTLDYCIGVAEAKLDSWFTTRVVCDGILTVWPEDKWGEGVFEV